jgi:hypothetical protein
MTDILDRLLQIYTEAPLAFWVLGTVLAYAAATNALWLANARGLQLPSYSNWLIQAARFLYYLGVPYLALGGWPRPPFSGLLSLGDMGLVGLGGQWPVTRWLESVGTGLGLGLVAFFVLILAWSGTHLRFSPRPSWATLVDVLYLEVHWAFYRGAMAVVLGSLYTGVFVGLGIVYMEWLLNPAWRRGWLSGSSAGWPWLRAALALVSALLFLSTRNLWVCLGVHALLELAFWGLGRRRAKAQMTD